MLSQGLETRLKERKTGNDARRSDSRIEHRRDPSGTRPLSPPGSRRSSSASVGESRDTPQRFRVWPESLPDLNLLLSRPQVEAWTDPGMQRPSRRPSSASISTTSDARHQRASPSVHGPEASQHPRYRHEGQRSHRSPRTSDSLSNVRLSFKILGLFICHFLALYAR
jgi:hypothetical protein